MRSAQVGFWLSLGGPKSLDEKNEQSNRVSDFPHKHFEGETYTFGHLAKTTLSVDLVVSAQPLQIPVHVTYGCHCFTEEFVEGKHGPHHRYSHLQEVRAFNVERYECSLQLPQAMVKMLDGKIYRADRSYTYVTQIALPPDTGAQAYSIFFSLEKKRQSASPAVELYVKSAYLSPLKHHPNAQSWRFKALVGKTAGVF